MRALKGIPALILVGLACAGPALAQQPQTVAATIVSFDFSPKRIAVDVGTTISWTNRSDRPHTATDRGGTFDTNPIPPGKVASVTFTVPGRYSYFCRINPARMNAEIIVGPSSEARVTRVQAVDPALEGETALRFDPAELSVEAGSTVLFANVGGKPHTLTADDGSFDTGVVEPGAEGGRFAGTNATFTPTKPGRFAFHCEVHPAAMKGVLTVTGSEARAPPAASAAPTRARVRMIDFAFQDPEVSIAPGGEATWSNEGNAQHTATFDDVSLDTGTVAPGSEGKLAAPSKPGSYSYRCTVHPARMRGVLVVVGQNVADPTKPVVDKPVAAAGAGPPGGVPALALATGVVGAFLGGFGISAFVRNKMGAGA